ncbi:Uncharacterised protein [Leminorella grimontii]|nr:Uncharacterised protein [Leminorella grimontii]
MLFIFRFGPLYIGKDQIVIIFIKIKQYILEPFI